MKRFIIIVLLLVCWVLAVLASDWSESGMEVPAWVYITIAVCWIIDFFLVISSEEI